VRIRSAGVRHAAWTAVLAAMLLMPVLPYVVPPIGIPVSVSEAVGLAPWAPGSEGAALPSVDGVDDESAAGQLSPRADAAQAPGSRPTPDPNGPVAPGTADWLRRAVGMWPLVALTVWGLGTLLLLLRLATGWVVMRGIIRTGRRVAPEWGRVESRVLPPPDESAAAASDLAPVPQRRPMWGPRCARLAGRHVAILESSRVATPLTTGIFAPRVILPVTWRSWPDEKLRAVLAHELAHVRRRDPLIALAAYLNRAIFWFHPLAWWLERTLATSAEDACDDAAVPVVGTPRRYAEVLLDMVEAVRRSRGRVAWQGVGVDGTGLLGQRIDRILHGKFFGEVSTMRKVIVGVGCATAIILVVACRPQQPQPPPLEPNPKVAESIAKQIAASEFDKAAKALTAQQVAALEASLQKNPEDAETRRKLQIFYQFSGQKTVGWNETVAARRRHILWLIEHHPGDEAILAWGPLYPAYDPAGFAQARDLWLTQTAKKDAPPDVLSNAAYFFETTDRPLAEQLLLRLEATDPGGPTPRMKGYVYRAAWSWRLGELYATAMLGISEWRPGMPKTSSEVARSAFAVEAHKKLATTKDTGILRGAARQLEWGLGPLRNETVVQTGLDPQATAASYLERVLRLEPGNEVVRKDLEALRASQRRFAFVARLRDAPRDKWPAIASALPEAERIERLPWFLDGEYMHAEYLEYIRHDPVGAKAARDQARKYADDLLALCNKLPNDPHRSEAFFDGHVALAGLALRDNDTAAALRHLDESVKVPAGAQVTDGYNSLWDRVSVGLLKRGERESVARFLEAVSVRTEPWLRDRLIKDAAAIRAGRMPGFYQSQVTPRRSGDGR
jgi:hypothetical protein